MFIRMSDNEFVTKTFPLQSTSSFPGIPSFHIQVPAFLFPEIRPHFLPESMHKYISRGQGKLGQEARASGTMIPT